MDQKRYVFHNRCLFCQSPPVKGSLYRERGVKWVMIKEFLSAHPSGTQQQRNLTTPLFSVKPTGYGENLACFPSPVDRVHFWSLASRPLKNCQTSHHLLFLLLLVTWLPWPNTGAHAVQPGKFPWIFVGATWHSNKTSSVAFLIRSHSRNPLSQTLRIQIHSTPWWVLFF